MLSITEGLVEKWLRFRQKIQLKVCKLRIRGGLGNQLFQFFAGAYFARHYSCPLIIDDQLVKHNSDLEKRNWIEKLPDICLAYLGVKKVERGLSRLISQVVERLPSSIHFTFNDANVADLSFVSKPFIFVEGWYQTPKYVSSFDCQIFFESLFDYMMFNSKDSLKSYGSDLQNAAIHFRLGDYVQHGWQIPFEWYFKRIDEIRDRGITRLFVFSDEIVVVKKALEKRYNRLQLFTFPEEHYKLNALELMFRMSFFKNFISSNSTLSWWSSFINHENKNYIVTPWDGNLALPQWKSIKP